jgi:cyclophilin family peptidyl-prolyl cis-trans isomerase
METIQACYPSPKKTSPEKNLVCTFSYQTFVLLLGSISPLLLRLTISPVHLMKYLISLLLLLSACRQKQVDIPQQEVESQLFAYGKENPETQILIDVAGFGKIKARLYTYTPLHRANFIRLAKAGYYDKSYFYRIVSDFMVQGGNTNPNEKPRYTLPAEFHREAIHKKGALAMARWDENNPDRRSSSTEFFIIRGRSYTDESLKDAIASSDRSYESYTPAQLQAYLKQGGDARIDGKYTVFGEVIEGIEVVEAIADQRVYDGEKPVKKIAFSVKVLN